MGCSEAHGLGEPIDLFPVTSCFARQRDGCPFCWSLRSPVPNSIINFSRKHQMLNVNSRTTRPAFSKGRPSGDQPSKPSIKMATAAPPSWSRMRAAVVARTTITSWPFRGWETFLISSIGCPLYRRTCSSRTTGARCQSLNSRQGMQASIRTSLRR